MLFLASRVYSVRENQNLPLQSLYLFPVPPVLKNNQGADKANRLLPSSPSIWPHFLVVTCYLQAPSPWLHLLLANPWGCLCCVFCSGLQRLHFPQVCWALGSLQSARSVCLSFPSEHCLPTALPVTSQCPLLGSSSIQALTFCLGSSCLPMLLPLASL